MVLMTLKDHTSYDQIQEDIHYLNSLNGQTRDLLTVSGSKQFKDWADAYYLAAVTILKFKNALAGYGFHPVH